MGALELDSVLFPVNVNAWENGGFGPQILAKAKSKGMARMALKALAFGKFADGVDFSADGRWVTDVTCSEGLDSSGARSPE